MRIVGLCGSLRSASLNRALLVALAARCPEGASLEVADLRGVPVYDPRPPLRGAIDPHPKRPPSPPMPG